MEELQEIRGALKMWHTFDSLPIHVQNQLDEFAEAEKQASEKEKEIGRRRSTL